MLEDRKNVARLVQRHEDHDDYSDALFAIYEA